MTVIRSGRWSRRGQTRISDLSANEDAANATINLSNVFNDVDDDNASITKALELQQQSRSRDRDDRGERPDPRLSSRPERDRDDRGERNLERKDRAHRLLHGDGDRSGRRSRGGQRDLRIYL